MHSYRPKLLTLRLIISLLVVSAVILALIISLMAAIEGNRNSLVSSYLVSNYQYAQKVSANTAELLDTMQENLESIAAVAKRDGEIREEYLGDLFMGNKQYFNSLFVVDNQRIIKAITPGTTGVSVGGKLNSKASEEANLSKRPYVSKPYISKTGRLIILVSVPILDNEDRYKGFVGGTIYLEENNSLNRTLEEHFFGNGSYVYVVDSSGRLIYHPDSSRIGEDVISNEAVRRVTMGQSGYLQILNTKGVPFFAGYAFENVTGWGIIAQTPVSVIDKPLYQLRIRLILQSLPFLGLIMLVGWWVAHRISKPLHQLAEYSSQATGSRKENTVSMPEIYSRTYEVNLLYESMRSAFTQIDTQIELLKTENRIDGLTGLANRKTFDVVLKEWTDSDRPFALILLDIDRFKIVNDTYGHLIGDDVLRTLAEVMVKNSVKGQLSFRYGGEEFALLLPCEERSCGLKAAEKLRKAIEQQKGPAGKPVTISLGVAMYPQDGLEMEALIHAADQAMYASKAAGRNRTTIYDHQVHA
ncbi:sensor domain-containing diguanylate cyclase [Paenibacillus sp. JX-17]|uniref:Sensor domain-containing diguanylate cyclase n=1 Tax=Paenibacillus lacisoli TaxID=3064525 RepID=A0ABT9C8V6_9BACL|nr:sensor domain-containing diguanylate cyclase [Paenibacillus sp. JX-17]MDO7905689.1 sensor domain-containing diguanylate cyclase [Paenibacillus sp. JX-17]